MDRGKHCFEKQKAQNPGQGIVRIRVTKRREVAKLNVCLEIRVKICISHFCLCERAYTFPVTESMVDQPRAIKGEDFARRRRRRRDGKNESLTRPWTRYTTVI